MNCPFKAWVPVGLKHLAVQFVFCCAFHPQMSAHFISVFRQHVCSLPSSLFFLPLTLSRPTNLLTQMPACLTSTTVCIQEQCHLQPDLHRQQRDTAGYRCWSLWCWGGDQNIEQSTASSGRPGGQSETSVGERERQKQKRLVLDCGRELLHCPVGEAQAGIQEHPSLVMAGGVLVLLWLPN